MKKSIALVCALLIVVSLFAACSGKKGNSSTTAPVSTTLDLASATFKYYGSVGTKILSLYDMSDALIQQIYYPEEQLKTFDYNYAKNNLQFVDLNFDGYADISLASHTKNGNIYYMCWLFDVSTERYVYSKELSALTTISVDAANKQIISTVKNGSSVRYVTYQWKNGALVKAGTVTPSSSVTVPSAIKKAVKDSTLGTSAASPAKTTSNSGSKTTTNKGKTTTENPKTPTTTHRGITIVTGNESNWY